MWGCNMNWYDNGNGMMNGSGYAIFGLAAMFIFFGILAWVIVKMVGHDSHSGAHHDHSNHSRNSSEALDHLNMRLAKGEIQPEEYTILKSHLSK